MKYPFTKCCNPQRIRNPHTGDWIKVPCGKCDACRNSKSSLQTMKCKLESLSHNYCMFVTLTYDDKHIPRIKLIPHPDIVYSYYAVLVTERLSDGEVLFDIELDNTARQMLSCKFQHEDYPILWKRDAQLFIKRFRKHLNTFSHEKIRYYLIGEYGPSHFRPHYHVLFWFNDKKIFENFGECLSRSWKFGRVDYSLSRGQCAQYVAQYVNGSVPLPRIFSFDETRPFSTHSFFLGEKILETKGKTFTKENFKDFVRRSVHFGDAYSEFTVWRSFESRIFPKCPRFGQLNEFECVKAYRTYELASQWSGENRVSYQVKEIMSCLQFGVKDDIIDYFRKFFHVGNLSSYSDCDKQKLYNQIFLHLSVSKHFLMRVCNNNSLGEIKNKINLIKEYYNWKDYECLKKQLVLEDEILRNPSCDDINITLFFDSVDNESLSLQNDFQPFVFISDDDVYNESSLVKQFRAESYKISHDKIKHKKLNDLNNIFNNL